MPNHRNHRRRTWTDKFRNAFRGLAAGVRGQNSFIVHFAATAGVLATGAILHVDWIEWCLLALCIAGVLAAELFNTALESMAQAISTRDDPRLGKALDVAGAAVLTAAIGAAAVGLIVFLRRAGGLLGWW